MDLAPPMGPAMRGRLAVAALVAGVLVCTSAARALAADRYALIVSGAAGDASYEKEYDTWRTSFSAILRARLGFAEDHVLVLADATDDVRKPTRENVRAALASIAQRAKPDDLVVILLMGHGNVSDVAGDEAKFNLIGPDLSAKEWAALVKPIRARIVFVDGASGSAPFLQALSARGRIVITATDTPAQQYETVFPEFFIRAFTADEADADKSGRVSVWEAFSYASAGVRQWYQQQGRLQTERALLDDNGDGVGREAQSPGSDGALAQATYLDAGPQAPSAADTGQSALAARRAALQSQIDQLKARQQALPPADYETQMERLLLDLARVDAQLRAR
jgi:hypothetical protein